jgi:hypothetical protein
VDKISIISTGKLSRFECRFDPENSAVTIFCKLLLLLLLLRARTVDPKIRCYAIHACNNRTVLCNPFLRNGSVNTWPQ